MKLLGLAGLLALAAGGLCARAATWQPSAGHQQMPIWPGTAPDAQPLPGPEFLTTVKDHPVAGRTWLWVSNVSRPTMTVYAQAGKNTGAAVVVKEINVVHDYCRFAASPQRLVSSNALSASA